MGRQRLVDGEHVKMIPGRKTDVGDAAGLAQLHRRLFLGDSV
jgi:hypothetical protein